MIAEPHLYTIQPHIAGLSEFSEYVTGTLPDGKQALVARVHTTMYCHSFDSEGRYLGRSSHTVARRVEPASYEERLADRQSSWHAWLGELGLVIGSIRIQMFNSGFHDPTSPTVRGPTLAIQEAPHWFEGDMGDDEDRARMLKWWSDIGGFVLFWDTTEHTLDSKGSHFR